MNNNNAGLSKERRTVFKLIAFLLPVIFLLIMEGMLRLFHYGHDTSLFITYPDDTSKWVMNQYASQPYFSDTVNATKGYIEPFAKVKKTNTFRVFVLGESTGEGYPYFHNGSFHRWLQYRLMMALPDKNIEIINLSLTAVNSYTVLDFGKQVINYQPDAVLVYVGHNEYYGALGIASTSRIGSNELMIKTLLMLHKLRFVQLLQNTINSFFSSAGHDKTDSRENLMKRMAGKQALPYGSADYQKGISQFSQNMDELCRFFNKRNIPLFISNLVSNEKDLKPFISAPETAEFSADKSFKTAKKAYADQQFEQAKKQFTKAKEYDMLRFRAPEAMDSIIAKLGNTYQSVHVVDSRAAFMQYSPHGILGSETILEHVHPNLNGYALMSDAFYRSLKKYKLIAPDTANEISFKELVNRMPVTPVDSLYGAYQVMMLKAGWPFNQKIPAGFKPGNSVAEQLAGPLSVGNITWAQAMEQLFKQSMAAGDKAMALKAAGALLLEHPSETRYYLYCGRLSFDLKDLKKAEFYFRKCYQVEPNAASAATLFMYYVKIDSPQKALRYVELAMQANPGNSSFSAYHDIIQDIITNEQQLKKNPANAAAKNMLAKDFGQLGENELATHYNQL